MEFAKKWRLLDNEGIGEGGQGKVYKVVDKNKYDILYRSDNPLITAIRNLLSVKKVVQLKGHLDSFHSEVVKMVEMEQPENIRALKILHLPEIARDPALAKRRLQREIKAMSDISHSNLIEIVDYDPDSEWFVSKFYPNGTLEQKINQFTGNVRKAFIAIRPLVEGVSLIHEAGYIHRDIKPGNIFIDEDESLVLGDFGLVFDEDNESKRLSKTFDKVGSTDWMPGWNMALRSDNVNPSFDVFALGKILWALVSKLPVLNLWYWDQEQFNLESMFPEKEDIWMVNSILKLCVVEKEADCLPDAKSLLLEIDNTIRMLDNRVQKLGDNPNRGCQVCGVGEYLYEAFSEGRFIQNMGLESFGGSKLKVCVCHNCGHIQHFFFPEGKIPSAWSEN